MKYLKVKKFMKETGCNKKTAYSYLRDSMWDYDEAIQLYHTPMAIKELSKNLEIFAARCNEAFENFGEAVANLFLPLKEER